jgi:hypothetical protein
LKNSKVKKRYFEKRRAAGAASSGACGRWTVVEIRLGTFTRSRWAGGGESPEELRRKGRKSGWKTCFFSLPRVGQSIHFKKIGAGYLVVTTKSYA